MEEINYRKAPDWVNGKNDIDEVLFFAYFIQKYPMIYVEGKFLNVDGEVDIDWLKRTVAEEIKPCMTRNVYKKVLTLIDAMKLYCFGGDSPLNDKTIHLKNGTLRTDGTFTEQKYFCRNRLNVSWIEYSEEQRSPKHFLEFLTELLAPQDIDTLQEYLGYCLIPSTRGQKMMFIIGSGGEGKSRIGVILQEIFGKSMLMGSFGRIENDKFFRYNLQNKLLMVDDDMQLEALKSTGYIKGLVTAETPIDVEAKGIQSHPARLYSRFLCFSNGSPKTLYDKTYGFSRRLLILKTKPKQSRRIDDPFIADSFIEEKDKIFRWMYDGLLRLIKNRYKFTESDRTRKNREEALAENCNIIDFIADKDVISIGGNYKTSSTELYSAYCIWCGDNGLEALRRDVVLNWLKMNQKRLGITYTQNVISSYGKHIRGFSGIKLLKKFSSIK